MRAVVMYESMYGNTHAIAKAVAEGLSSEGVQVVVAPVGAAEPGQTDGVDLLVLGGPTHAHGMTWPKTRVAAAEAALEPGSRLVMDPAASGLGLREWFAAVDHLDMDAAAFDTRMCGPVALTGQASRGIARRLRKRGAHLVAPAESFLVTKANELVPGEQARAHAWGAALAVSGRTRSLPAPY